MDAPQFEAAKQAAERKSLDQRERMGELDRLRHSAAHIMAAAVLRLWPEARLDIGPATEDGFYYDFDLPRRFTPEDFPKIEAEMRKIVKENQPFVKSSPTRAQARAFWSERRQTFKLERLADIPDGEAISFYQNGDFIDLCAGPHVLRTGNVRAFKLLAVASAYFRGNEKNPQVQRLYGTAFKTQEELEQHLQALAQAKERDHRKLGRQMELFAIDEQVGQGLVLWMPKGAIIRQQLQEFISQELRKQGYQEVFTPHIGRLGLFRTSGHFPYYRESQFPPILEHEQLAELAREKCSCADLANRLEKGDVEGFLLKPMNCPMHIRIFDQRPRSYREMPVRLAEFGTVYRWEQSGELGGMIRVRGFTQDDAHLFVTEEQLPREIMGCLDLVNIVLNTLGLSDYRVRVSLRDPAQSKYVGDPADWQKAEAALLDAARQLNVPFEEAPGEAAFYGPKIDFLVKDVIGRQWQLGTVQVDYNLPQRFDLNYIGPDNKPHRPVMVHRAPFGSMERFVGVLIEHFNANFPLWLAPEQVRLLTIGQESRVLDYAHDILNELRGQGVRAEIDPGADKINGKILRAEEAKVHTMLVVGPRDLEASAVSVRLHGKGNQGSKPRAQAVTQIVADIRERKL